jgi:hypothetical protein
MMVVNGENEERTNMKRREFLKITALIPFVSIPAAQANPKAYIRHNRVTFYAEKDILSWGYGRRWKWEEYRLPCMAEYFDGWLKYEDKLYWVGRHGTIYEIRTGPVEKPLAITIVCGCESDVLLRGGRITASMNNAKIYSPEKTEPQRGFS